MANTKNSRSLDPLCDSLRAVLDRLGYAGKDLCVGLSGGRDSMVLLDALSYVVGPLGCSLSAVHVHHGLSENADQWSAFCEAQCRARQVPIQIRRVHVEQDGGAGLEAAARAARYGAFAELNTDFLLLAHHQGDQAETVLHNLIRGAGSRGVAGMPEVRRLHAGSVRPLVVRPLLHVSPSAIQRYAEQHALEWIEDESNNDIGYTRNFLRHRVIPILKERFPKLEQTISEVASRFGEDAHLLEELAIIDRDRVSRNGRVQLARLRELSSARIRNLLRLMIRGVGESAPDARTLAEAVRQLTILTSDTDFEFRFARHELKVYAGELYWLALGREPTLDAVLWKGQASVPWGDGEVKFTAAVGSGFSVGAGAGIPLRLVPRSGGERLKPDAKRPRRSLKQLYQEAKIPPWERERRPVLWCGDRVVWVPGLGIDAEFSCEPGEPGWLPEWVSSRG